MVEVSPQPVEHSLCLLQILRVKALGERSVDRREETECFLASALIDPQRGAVRCGSKFECPGVLASCRVQCMVEQCLRLGFCASSAADDQHPCLQPIQFG